MIDPGFILNLVDKHGVIQAVKGNLIRQPDAAAERLTRMVSALGVRD